MAALAADALSDVNAVVEIDVVRYVGDAPPHDGLVCGEAVAHRSEQGGVRPDLGVTGHADVGRGHPCVRRLFDAAVTKAAVNTQSGHVMLMAKGHRLRCRGPKMLCIVSFRPEPPERKQRNNYD